MEKLTHTTFAFMLPHGKHIRFTGDAIEAELIDAAFKNSERYCWLRAQNWDTGLLAVVADPKSAIKLGYDAPSLARLDEAIDAAMVAEKVFRAA